MWYVHSLLDASLWDTARLSGWGLLGMVLFLAAYNLRKKLPALPLGSSATWMQLHLYAGLLTAVAFGLHVRWRLPSGIFEFLLAFLFALVFTSGIIGLLLSRSLAKRLTTRNSEVLFERIGAYRKRIASQAESVVLGALEKSDSAALSEFYRDRLKPFFRRPRNVWHHLLQSSRPQFALQRDIRAIDRFLGEDQKAAMQQLESLVKAKHDLDYQYALQATLKYWLFVHVPATYAMIVLAFVHLLLVTAFAGAAL